VILLRGGRPDGIGVRGKPRSIPLSRFHDDLNMIAMIGTSDRHSIYHRDARNLELWLQLGPVLVLQLGPVLVLYYSVVASLLRRSL